MTVAVQPARPRRWPAASAWALWALAMLGLAAVAWLDHLSRQAGANLGSGQAFFTC